MAQGLIPALYTEGVFVVNAPFDSLLGGVTYQMRCVAIRGFEDIYAEGIDVFTEYYEPQGLNNSIVVADQKAKVCIITLETGTGLQFHIPSSYLGTLPNGNYVPYSHIVLSISLSSIPDALDLTFLKSQLTTACSDAIGVEPVVTEHKAPTLAGTAVTPAQHASMEAGRIAAINNRETIYGENLRLRQQVADLLAKNETLSDKVIELSA